jgi:hypothetical protein
MGVILTKKKEDMVFAVVADSYICFMYARLNVVMFKYSFNPRVALGGIATATRGNLGVNKFPNGKIVVGLKDSGPDIHEPVLQRAYEHEYDKSGEKKRTLREGEGG